MRSKGSCYCSGPLVLWVLLLLLLLQFSTPALLTLLVHSTLAAAAIATHTTCNEAIAFAAAAATVAALANSVHVLPVSELAVAGNKGMGLGFRGMNRSLFHSPSFSSPRHHF